MFDILINYLSIYLKLWNFVAVICLQNCQNSTFVDSSYCRASNKSYTGLLIACECSHLFCSSPLKAVLQQRCLLLNNRNFMYRWCKICPESGQELWLVHMVVKLFKLLFSILDKGQMVTKLKGGAHNLEWANSILGLCHSVFTDQFIFRHILGHLFLRK